MCNVPIAPHITSQLLKFPLLRPWGEGEGQQWTAAANNNVICDS